MKENKQKVTLYIPPDLHRKLKIKAAIDADVMSSLVEKAVSYYIDGCDAIDEIPSTREKIPGVEFAPEPIKQLALKARFNSGALTEDVALELAELCKALNAYHIACGGTGLRIDDWEIFVRALELVGA